MGTSLNKRNSRSGKSKSHLWSDKIRLRLELVDLFYKFYEVDYEWNNDNHEVWGFYKDEKIKLQVPLLDMDDSLFWSVVFHELAHHLSFKYGLFKKAFTGSLDSKISYIEKNRSKIEDYADRLGSKLLKTEYPELDFATNY